jgi:nucleotide-binding universal stress UspA family protein
MDTDPLPAVAGYDGSAEADRALQYAARLSERNGWPLRVVIARGDLYRLSAWADDWTRGLAEEWAALARKALAGTTSPDCEIVVRDGRPSEVLIAESASAACLIVGASGHGALTGRLQGSVSQHVAAHALSPVVVARTPWSGSARIVVGVDGSEPSLRALEFALRQARADRQPVDVMYAPEHARTWGIDAAGVLTPALRAELLDHDDRVLASIAHLVERFGDVAVSVRTVRGRPSTELVDASREAGLVVVGSRGAGAFAGLLLGSVSAAVLRRAQCSVAVIR